MKQSLGLVSLVVRDYDEALGFFAGKLGFRLVEDAHIPEQSKRWVVIAPPGASESRLLLARASSPEQESRIGAQTGGRVFLFLFAVFKDLYGNVGATCGTFCNRRKGKDSPRDRERP